MKLKKILLFGLMALSSQAFAVGRGELQRFTLLHDRFTIDRDLKKEKQASFLDIDLFASSGLKDMIGDISGGTADGLTPVQKQLAMFNVLTKYVNTETIIDLDVNLGAPLPDIRWGKNHLYPGLFFNINLGVSVSFSNAGDASNPYAQTYVRKEQKVGLFSYLKRNEQERWSFALYQLTRSDTLAQVTSSQLASSGELFNFDDLTKNHNMLALDLAYVRTTKKSDTTLEFKELPLMELSSDQDSRYGSRPLLHARYQKFFDGGKLHWAPFIGLHFRQWYSPSDGVYGGAKLSYYKSAPFNFTFKMSNQFFTLMPEFETKYFQFSYSMKTPYSNPQDDLWVASIHNLSINFPIP